MRILVALDTSSDFDERVREVLPAAIVMQSKPGDGGYESALETAQVILGWPGVEDLSRASRLEWFQLSSAGADHYIDYVPPGVVLTTANGVHGVPVSEHALALMLSFARGIHRSVRKQERRRWETTALGELFGRSCGILGLGDIGTEIARRASAFGMHVTALKRRRSDPPPFVDRVYVPDEIGAFLRRADYVVDTLPETPATRHLMDAARFGEMKAGSYFINVGRGGTVDEEALIDALQSGRLAGAGLDVFEREPLPPESPLWEMENVVITPHEGGQSPRLEERVEALFLENLRRLVGRKPLLNVVDRREGY